LPLVEQEFLVLALDRADGSLVWKRTASKQTPHESSHADGSFASPTLVTDGERVIASFGSFGLYAYDMAGEPLWSKDLGDMSITRAFGEGSSPVLRDGVLVVDWEHEGDSFVVALDAASGEERWRQARPSGTSWASPLVLEADGGPVVVIGGPRTVAYELATGAERWSYGEAPAPSRGGSSGNIASPVVYQDVLVLLSGGRRGGFEAIAVAPDAEGALERDSARLWTHDGDAPHVPSPLAHDGILYALKGNSGVLTAMDLSTGETLYSQRLEGVQNIYASPVLADGRLYLAGRDGAVEVVAAGPEPETLAVNRLDDAFDASPAVAGDELFLRGRRHVYCVAEEEDEER
jgi:outer membrane protein assembly factor BamB